MLFESCEVGPFKNKSAETFEVFCMLNGGLICFILTVTIFFSTPNEKLLGRLVKEKVTITLEYIILSVKTEVSTM